VASAARRTADQTAKAFITFLRDRLKKVLGRVYTWMWAEAGFVNNSLWPRGAYPHLVCE
jgi:hypothetical protein